MNRIFKDHLRCPWSSRYKVHWMSTWLLLFQCFVYAHASYIVSQLDHLYSSVSSISVLSNQSSLTKKKKKEIILSGALLQKFKFQTRTKAKKYSFSCIFFPDPPAQKSNFILKDTKSSSAWNTEGISCNLMRFFGKTEQSYTKAPQKPS